MRQDFKLQDPGEGIHEVEILEVLVAEGDTVKEGQNVLVVESDKAAIELPSPHAGTIAEMRVKEGDTAEVGDILLVIDDEQGGAKDDADGGKREDDDAEGEAERAEAEDAAEEADRDVAEDDAERDEADEGEGPRAGRAKDEEEEPTEDREENDAASEDRVEDEDEQSEQKSSEKEGAPVRASPAARKLAREHDIDLANLDPSGSDGQVTEEDVRAAFAEKSERDGDGDADLVADSGKKDEFGLVERQRMSAIRAATARTMTRSWREIPHVHHEDAADITEFERWRLRQDDPPTLTPVVAKAVAVLLPHHPRFNASFDGEADEIVLRRYLNISFAVATDRGLVTPVVKDADGKSVRTLAEEMGKLAEKAWNKKLQKSDISGGTFTITNIGGLGGRGLSPLINPPQTAILGLARARMESVARGSLDDPRFEARMILPMVLGFDHRVIDGADAARFMNDLVALLSDPISLALET